MLKEILLDKVGKKIILLGNEAIVRGALESGVQFASTYPGTPASEIGDTFSKIAKEVGIYFEYSTNEKVAFEAAAGAALSGIRSIVSFKQYGLNVASDSVLPIAYVGTNAGIVIAVADDPGCYSSAQSEQDSRYYARLGHIPMLEPSDPQECKDFTKIAFELSERFMIPVFIRLTTRVSHVKGVVKLGRIKRGSRKGNFVKDIKRYYNLPPRTVERHEELLEKIEKIRKFSEKTKINHITNKNAKTNFCIITSGVSFNYVMEALKELDLKVPVLKIGLSYPLPKKLIKSFIKKFKSILVVEELEPILENEIGTLAKEVNPKLKIIGKELLAKAGEYDVDLVVSAISRISGKKLKFKANLENYKKLKITKRLPVFCPGCPHRATFYATKVATGKDVIFGGDIGCYLLGIFHPFETQDFIFNMGASEGVAHGIKKVSKQKVIAFIGDSTFFHAGIPALINIVYNNSNPLVIILDNRITAMTGHQPHPGSGVTGMGDKVKEIKIDEISKACGIKNVKVVDPFNVNGMIESIKEFLKNDEASVIVAKRECHLLATRRKRRLGIKIPVFEIDQEKCDKCGVCLYRFGCPAISEEGGEFKIDKNICWGCSVCAQICPKKAIHMVKE